MKQNKNYSQLFNKAINKSLWSSVGYTAPNSMGFICTKK